MSCHPSSARISYIPPFREGKKDRSHGRPRLADRRFGPREREENRSGRSLRQRILLFVAGREERGAAKNELFADFKHVPPAQIMEELDHLMRLGPLFGEDLDRDVRQGGRPAGDVAILKDGPQETDCGEPKKARDSRSKRSCESPVLARYHTFFGRILLRKSETNSPAQRLTMVISFPHSTDRPRGWLRGCMVHRARGQIGGRDSIHHDVGRFLHWVVSFFVTWGAA